MADDYSGDSFTTGTLAVGGNSTGNFDTSFDEDWFKLTLDAGKTYLLTFSGLYSGGGTFQDMRNLWLELHDAGGKLLDAEWGNYSLGSHHATPPVALQFVPAISGTYFLAASYSAGTWGGLNYGNYTVAAAIQAPDDLPSDTSTSAVLPAGGDAQANFEVAGDRDWFRFHAQAGQHYNFMGTTEAGASPGIEFAVYDPSGQPVADLVAVFEPGTTGDYFVSAAGHDVGHYSIHSVILDDDYSANNTSPGVLAIGGQISGGLQYQHDVDRFKVSLQAGVIYKFNLTAAGQDAAKLGMAFVDGDGHKLASSGVRDADGTLHQSFTASSTGDFYIKVQASDDYRLGVIVPQYTLSSDAMQQDDYGDTPARATALAIGDQLHGSLQSPVDVDMLAVSLQAGTTYGFGLRSDSGAQYPQLALDVDDASGARLAGAGFGNAQYFTYTPTASGTYYLAAHSSQQSTAEGAYTLTTSLAPDDVGASAASAGQLALGTSVNGALEAGGGDRDWYAISLNGGATYVVSLSALKLAEAWPRGGMVKLLDAHGNTLASQQGDGNDQSLLSFEPAATGTYYVEVSAPDRATGNYTLAVAPGEHDDYGNDAAHATALVNEAATPGRLEIPGDHDVFKLHAVAGQYYVVHVVAPDQHDAIWSSEVSVGVTGPHDHYVSLDTTYPWGEEIYGVLHAAETGDYELTVAGRASGTAHDYVITATSVGTDDYDASRATTGVLGENATLRGNIAFRSDQDWIKVHLDAGKSYTFDLHGTATGAGTLDTANWQARLALLDSNGNELRRESADHREPHVELTAAASGDYYLRIDAGDHGTGSYTVSATTVSPSVPTQRGGAGADVLRGGGAGQWIDGADGTDMVVYGGAMRDYAITPAQAMTLVQRHDAGLADTLVNVERLAFDDAFVALDVNGAGGQAYRLYQAAFNRAPRAEGLGFWMDALDHGASLDQVAGQFIGSAEFQRLYGAAPSDTDFVNQLFHNVLHRDGKPAGIAFWVGGLHDGVTREHVLAEFSESPENQAALLHIIGQGMGYTPHG